MGSGAPAHYDDGQSINVDPQGMWTSGSERVGKLLDDVVDSWKSIGNTWKNLELSWAGETAEEVQQFNYRLQKLQWDLFGSEEHETVGLIYQVRGIVQSAASNYGEAEEAVVKMFDEFTAAIPAKDLPPEDDGEGDGGTPPPVDLGDAYNTTESPVHTLYPNNPDANKPPPPDKE
ncbi:hypothetical protein [Micromonospora sp. NPDC003241]